MAAPATLRVLDAQFKRAVMRASDLPASAHPRAAVVGRSNVGKSSLINRVTGRKKLARTSGTPGCTREFNLFEITMQKGKSREVVELLDLPGFGFAKFSKAERSALRKKILEFVEEAEGLRCLVLLNDIRRMPEEDELALREVAFEAGVSVLIVLTKADKLGRNEAKKQTALIAKAYGLEPQDLVLAGEGVPASAFWDALMPHLEEGR